MKIERQQRVEHANALIRVISDHGRRFFYNETANRIARIEIDGRGRVWFIDDYKGSRIYTHATVFGNHWRGFSHGGTLRSLVESMRDYIMTGKQIGRWRIATERSFTDGDIWGYGPDAAKAVRAAAFELPIMAPEEPRIEA
ncbi:hypothetical protein [Caballeronia sp. KNU42]